MSLDDWRYLNYLFQDIVVLSFLILTVYGWSIKVYLQNNVNIIFYYFLFNTIIELINKAILKYNEESIWLFYLNNLFMVTEAMFLLYYLYLEFGSSKKLKIIFILLFCFYMVFIGFRISNIIDTESFKSLMPTIVYSLLFIWLLYHIVQKRLNKNILRSSSFIISAAFLIAFSSQILLFFILPKVIEYSRVLANQILICRHILVIFTTIIVGYGYAKTTNNH